MKKQILFITGNENKFREFKEIISSIEFRREKLDLPELQGEIEDIVKEKAKIAAQITKEACFVDDTSLCFDEWEGLPGPYIRDFIEKLGPEKLSKALLNSTGNISAKAITSIGYCEPGEEPICIQGITQGTISLPRGDKNFKKGWDTIFTPNGSKMTNAEMEPEEKHIYSQRAKAIKKFETFLNSLP